MSKMDEAVDRNVTMSEYVPVIFARNMTRAKLIKNTLQGRGISALVEIGYHGLRSMAILPRRIPLLVPEDRLEEASEIVAQLERRRPVAGFEEEEEDDFDDDFFEEEEFDDEEFVEGDDGDEDVFDDDEDDDF